MYATISTYILLEQLVIYYTGGRQCEFKSFNSKDIELQHDRK